jgi:hypothetical protein
LLTIDANRSVQSVRIFPLSRPQQGAAKKGRLRSTRWKTYK